MTAAWAAEQLASVPKWFSDEDAFSEHQAHVHKQEGNLSIPVIQNLLDGKIDQKTAAADIAAVCEERITKNDDIMAPEGIWKAFCSAVAHFAHENTICDRLIQLLVELSKIDVLGANGVPVASSMNSDTFWRQLPGFSLSFRDEMTGTEDIGALSKDESRYSEAKRRFHSGNLFQAKWLSQVGQDGPVREYGSALNIALWNLRAALEVKTEASPMGLQRVEIYVPGSVQWFLHAGEIIFQLCKDNVRNEGQKVVEPPFWDEGISGYEYAGDDGFNLERWDFWKASLDRTRQLQGVKADVLEVAEKALAKMEQIEKTAKSQALGGT